MVCTFSCVIAPTLLCSRAKRGISVWTELATFRWQTSPPCLDSIIPTVMYVFYPHRTSYTIIKLSSRAALLRITSAKWSCAGKIQRKQGVHPPAPAPIKALCHEEKAGSARAFAHFWGSGGKGGEACEHTSKYVHTHCLFLLDGLLGVHHRLGHVWPLPRWRFRV